MRSSVKLSHDMVENAKKLNDPSVLPLQAYRRNHKVYELVSYVNCLVGCRISGNVEGSTLFEGRIAEFLLHNPPDPDFEAYYEAVKDYVR